MTRGAGVGHLYRQTRRGRDEAEGVGANFHVRNGWLNLWHVAADAFCTPRASGVMRVLRYVSRFGPVGRPWVMTLEAEARSWFQKVGVIIRAVNIVATETSDASRVHYAGHKIIALHPVAATRSIREIGPIGSFGAAVVKLPVFAE